MTRHRFCAVFVVLLVMDTVRAEEPSWKCWCDPAIQRGEATEPASAEPQPGGADGLIGETQKAADRLYAEAVRFDDEAQLLWAVHRSTPAPELWSFYDPAEWNQRGETALSMRERAADKFITLLEQCPAYHQRDDVVKRLRDIADDALEAVREGARFWRTPSQLFDLPKHSPNEQAALVRDAQVRARKMAETVEKSVSARSLDGDTFTWGPALFALENEWRFAEEYSRIQERLASPPDGGIEIWAADGTVVDFGSRQTSGSAVRGAASSRVVRQIIMRLQCEPPEPPFFCCPGGFEH
jgi:hypothetical protein